MDGEPGKVRERCSKRRSVGETCPVHSGVDPQEDQDRSTDCGVRSPCASSLPTRRMLAPPPTVPAAGQALPASTRLFILGQLRTGHLSCGAQGLPSRKRIGELAPRREGWAGNWTLLAAQRSENLWKSDLALGVLSQGHESPSGTENRWHSANTSRRQRMRPSSWGGHKVELQRNPAPRAWPPDAPEVAALPRASRESFIAAAPRPFRASIPSSVYSSPIHIIWKRDQQLISSWC
ncbi:uncharacterized protein LOC106995235 [Macaca mulatta]|uniref:uncharacterized protein LOC106995235 n=1 Tax=Macaca mulatta TaxID=9544 RepID=UPI0010A25787|nr:uncharacterized protein LOC106995235 [Macaca mulatta]XP_028697750.1 uncharacterized protein LOC106995235 [Macaca mulatta]